MGVTINFEFGDLKRMQEAWASSRETVAPILEEAMERAASLLQAQMRTYPEQRGDLHLQGSSPPPFYSEKQKRWFFGALQRDEIVVPYERTNALEESWQVQPVEASDTHLHAAVFTNLAVAKWVQSSLTQAGMFFAVAPYWQTAQDVVRDQKEPITALFNNAVEDWFRREFVALMSE